MKDFEQRLIKAKTEGALSKLAYEVLDDYEHIDLIAKKIEMLLDAGLSEFGFVDGEPWFWVLIYRETESHLQAAKIILERIDILKIKDDGETIFEYLQSKIDYYNYNSDYLVRLFLLFGAYLESVKGLTISENLYREMFSNDIVYSGAIDISKGSLPLQLNHKIFNNTDFYDWCVEMEEQVSGYYGCWHMHIFDKKSKIKIATYH